MYAPVRKGYEKHIFCNTVLFLIHYIPPVAFAQINQPEIIACGGSEAVIRRVRAFSAVVKINIANFRPAYVAVIEVFKILHCFPPLLTLL